MAAPAALNVVKQIQQVLADGPKEEMTECLSQVVASVQFFLDHPDSVVRVQAARTLVKLADAYPAEIQKLDLSRAKLSLTRVTETLDNGDNVDEGAEDVQEILEELFDVVERSHQHAAAEAVGRRRSVENLDKRIGGRRSNMAKRKSDVRGEVVLNVGEEVTTADHKAAILEEVVLHPGVLSATFEDTCVIINTRTQALATDENFIDELQGALQAHGVEHATVTKLPRSASGAMDSFVEPAVGVPRLAIPPTEESESSIGAEPTYLDDDEPGSPRSRISSPRSRHGSSPMSKGGSSPIGPRRPLGPQFMISPRLSMDGYPDCEGSTMSPLHCTTMNGLLPQWSFFSQGYWLTGRRAQEFEDDPTVAARLVKAKLRHEQRKLEERSRFGRLLSALSLT